MKSKISKGKVKYIIDYSSLISHIFMVCFCLSNGQNYDQCFKLT